MAGQQAVKTTYNELGDLSAGEKRVVLMMRGLTHRHEKIEIRLTGDGEALDIVSTTTQKETFPKSML